MEILQRLVFPNLDMLAPVDLYIRPNPECFVYRDEEKLVFRPGGECSFDTYFNSLSLDVWSRETVVNNIRLRLRGKGLFLLTVGINRLEYPFLTLRENMIDLQGEIDVNLGNLASINSGMLFFRVRLLSRQGEISGGEYYTPDAPSFDTIKLGVVVTHFNRREYVLPAINRISKKLLSDSYYADRISLVVVDNSSNISKNEAQGAILLPNKNLGGSGGFTRGLLYLKDNGYTHCLFMDDDASCEIESIRRAYALLMFSRDKRTAISGALFSETKNNILIEKGAILTNHIRPLYAGLCMSSVNDLLIADSYTDSSPNYGAWWFFAFNISEILKYPFPFFVRGDDILFGVLNKFHVVTINGIACWGEDFFIKESPMTRYLGIRGELVARILSSTITKKDIMFSFLKRYLTALFSYNYDSATAIRMAVEDLLKGPSTFSADLDASLARAKIAALKTNEKLVHMSKNELNVVYPRFKTGILNAAMRLITLNGLLIPSVLMKNRVVYQHKGFRAVFREIFLYKKVLYWSPEQKKGYIAEHDKKRLFSGLWAGLQTLRKINKSYENAITAYMVEKERLTSEEFWRGVYSESETNIQ